MGSSFNTINPFLSDGVVTPDDSSQSQTSPPAQVGGGSSTGSGGMFRIIGRGLVGGIALVEIGPAIRIGPKDIVTVSPDAANTGNLYFSNTCPSAAQVGPRVTFPSPGLNILMNSRSVKVRNLNEIFVASDNAGDALLVDVQWHTGE